MAKSAPASSSSSSEPARRPERPTGNAPVFVCRHRALKAAVWKNDSENGAFFNVTLARSYKDGDNWKESSSFGYDDVLIVAELLRTCHGFISREIAKASEEGRE